MEDTPQRFSVKVSKKKSDKSVHYYSDTKKKRLNDEKSLYLSYKSSSPTPS